eukprot:jgi/Mesen1/4225/ME000219S03354
MGDTPPTVYQVYRLLTAVAAPLIKLHHQWHRGRGSGGQRARWGERLGVATVERPAGDLLWFHAVSVGESVAAVPVVKRCLKERPSLKILFTTRDDAALALLESTLAGQGVICQYAPLDTASACDPFLAHWRPQAAVLIESELWPNLLLSPRLRQNTEEGARLQALGANPASIHFAGDLKYATTMAPAADRREPTGGGDGDGGGVGSSGGAPAAAELREWLSQRRHVWLAASTHEGEDALVARVHARLAARWPRLLTVIAPRHPQRAPAILQALATAGISRVAQRSKRQPVEASTQIYLADTIGEMAMLYGEVAIACVCGAFLPHLRGHNVAEPAAASCAVLTGPHVGHFQAMINDLNRVADEEELCQALQELLSDEQSLRERQLAASLSASTFARNVVDRVWGALDDVVLSRAFGESAI